MLTIYNSLTKTKHPFKPITPGKVRMYVCGMTVYDYCHLGHARVMIVFDMISRYLRFSGYDLMYVRNITDIDDKIIQRAHERNLPICELTKTFITAMQEDAKALGVIPPDEEPKASEYITQIINMVSTLIEKGLAYQAKNQDIYYHVDRFTDYGKLSGKKIETLQSGARVAVEKAKKAAFDFVLWKAAKPNEPYWNSPWGPGRPGWHIECSAMSTYWLGDHFDIHGGGQDLQFPHHENEIAQSVGATGKPFANIWMHNGFVRVAEEKMSKSAGNFFTVREVMTKYPAEVIRFFILSSHYRSPLNYSSDNLDIAKQALTGLYNALRNTKPLPSCPKNTFFKTFSKAMDDDFNTPKAIAILHEIAHHLNCEKDAKQIAKLASSLYYLGGILGLLQTDPQDFLRTGTQLGLNTQEIEEKITQRNAARAARDFKLADKLREHLTAQGITLEDTENGTIWRYR